MACDFLNFFMNQELFAKMTKWVLYAAIGVLVVAVFFSFFGDRKGDRETMKKNKPWATLGTDEGISSRAGIGAGGGMDGSVSPGAGMMEGDSFEASKEMPAPDDMMMNAVAAPSANMEKKVIRNGNLSIRVEDAAWSADEIDRIATRLGGFTASRSLSGDIPGYPLPMMTGEPMMRGAGYAVDKNVSNSETNMPQSGFVVIKVPSGKFSEAISSIRAIASVVLNESSSASDVTMQFADLEAQIRNKRTEEEAFTKILNTNTGKVSDILEVTRELARVRGEIEQLETQKKYMESETDMAELSISLTEDAKVGATTDAWRPWQTVKEAMNQLLVKFQGFVDGVIYFIVSVLPFFLLYLLGLYIVYRVGRNVYRKMRGQE